MRMLSDLLNRMPLPTMKGLAFVSVCYAGFAYQSSGAGLPRWKSRYDVHPLDCFRRRMRVISPRCSAPQVKRTNT